MSAAFLGTKCCYSNSIRSIVNSWLTYASSFGLALSYGAGQTALFGIIIAAATQWIVLLGLAEMCSAFPSSGVGLVVVLIY